MVVVEAHLNRWLSHIEKIKEWIIKDTEASKARALKHLDNMAGQMQGIINTIEDSKKPRTIENALKWVAQKGKGSYIALLTDTNELVRTLRVSGDVIGEAKISVDETEVSVVMKKRVLTVEGLDIERNIPKKAEKFQWLFVDDKGKVTKGK